MPLSPEKRDPLEQCIYFRGLFDEKCKKDDILFQVVGEVNIKELHFSKYQDRGKG